MDARVREAVAMERAPFIRGKFEISQKKHLQLALSNVNICGNWAEFGIWKGNTARILLQQMPDECRLFLFDSFNGLPEHWKEGFPKGAFRLPRQDKPVFNNPKVEIIEGYFEDTMPSWAKSQETPLSFIFIDCDLYSSTKTVLENISHLIVPGTVIVFDEYYVPEIEKDEMLAFLEFVSVHGMRYRYLARAQNGSVSVIIN